MESCCCVAVVMELDVFWECNLSSVDFSIDKKASSLVSPLLGAMLMEMIIAVIRVDLILLFCNIYEIMQLTCREML